MRHGSSRRWSHAMLAMALTALTSGALADETVTLTTFYPQQPAQTTPLPAAQPCTGTLPNFRITTTNQGRLLILWTLDVTATAGNTYARGQVVLGGVPTGPLVQSAKLAASDSQTISGSLVMVPAVNATTVDLACTVGSGSATANIAGTTLSVIELK